MQAGILPAPQWKHARQNDGSPRYRGFMSAQPAEPAEEPLDPERILRELPERERGNFLAAYREAAGQAVDPSRYKHLHRVLRRWSYMAIAASRPGFYEAQDAALAGAGEQGGTAVLREARNALLRLTASPFAAYITGYDTCHVAALAAFRFEDGTEVPSGLGGDVPGESLVLALWDEVRAPVIEAAGAWEAETADPSGAEWLSENY